MPIFLNRKPSQRLPKGKRRMGPVRPSRSIAPSVRQAIATAMGPLALEVEHLIPWLESAATPAQAAAVLRELQDRWRQVFGVKADQIARAWVARVSAQAKKRLEENLARSLGIDMAHVFDDVTVRDAAALMNMEAASLIKNMPEEFLEEVRRAVLSNFQQLPQPEGRSLEEQIQELIGSRLDTRARLIARDQTSKINTAINMARQTSVGITEYIWRTARDSRVVGNPAGLFPEGNDVHGDHWKREGQIFRIDSPPHDGHPGYAINCRCYSEPIIEVDKLRDAA